MRKRVVPGHPNQDALADEDWLHIERTRGSRGDVSGSRVSCGECLVGRAKCGMARQRAGPTNDQASLSAAATINKGFRSISSKLRSNEHRNTPCGGRTVMASPSTKSCGNNGILAPEGLLEKLRIITWSFKEAVASLAQWKLA